jgi:predicted MFS family arabinose efflux permease
VTLVVTLLYLPEDIAARAETAPAAKLSDIPRYFADPKIAPVLVQKLAFSLGLYAWFSVFALVLGAVSQFSPSQISYFFAIFGAASVVIQLFVVGRLVDRVGVRTTSNLGFAAALAFFALVPFMHDRTILAIQVVLFAFGLSTTNATLATLLTDSAPERVRGTVLGVGSSLEAIAGVSMPIVATAVFATYGAPYSGAISALFVAVALALGIAAQRRGALA